MFLDGKGKNSLKWTKLFQTLQGPLTEKSALESLAERRAEKDLFGKEKDQYEKKNRPPYPMAQERLAFRRKRTGRQGANFREGNDPVKKSIL